MNYNYKIYLASQSPRRIEFLKQLNLDFEHFSVDIDESRLKDESVINYLDRVVHKKRDEALKRIDSGVVIVADTIVTLGEIIFQKPTDDINAKEILESLSNRWHKVITGFSVTSKDMSINEYHFVTTEVLFKKLSENEISFYISTKEHTDKAGGYALQGVGSFMIEKIVGSYSNVIGLPIKELFEVLQKGVISL